MSSLRSRVKSAKAVLTFSPNVELPLRYRCRNPRCRCKLPAPVVNERDAFCCRGCFTGYFRSRCIVCERPMERMREDQYTCRRPRCRAELRRDRTRFFAKWGQIPGASQLGVETPIESGIKTAHKSGRPWRPIAGPPMSSEAFRLATVGSERVVQLEREQKAAVEAHLRASDPILKTQREALYVAAVKQFRDRGWGKPVAAPALRIPTSCDWEPASNIDPANVPDIPEFLMRVRKESP